MTAKEQIVKALAEAPEPVPIHHLGLIAVSETAASARLRELARAGVVVSFPVAGKKFKAWALRPGSDRVMNLSAGIKRETWGCLPAIHGTQQGPLVALSKSSRQGNTTLSPKRCLQPVTHHHMGLGRVNGWPDSRKVSDRSSGALHRRAEELTQGQS